MAVLTALDDAAASSLADAYGLGRLGAVRGIAAGSVNSNFELTIGGRPYFLRLYEERGFAGAEWETAMLERLAYAGVPTPSPLRRTDGRLVSEAAQKPAVLFPWKSGTMRCQASVRPADVRRVGAALARVHQAGAGETCDGGRFRYEDLVARIDAIASSGVAPLAATAPGLRASLDEAHQARARDLPAGLVHGDLFRDNVLWEGGGELAALLDFESAFAGTYAFDLMVTVLAWCVGDALNADLARAMVSGYESERRLSPVERAGLWAEGRFAALRFTITRITDYALRGGAAGPRVVKDWRRFAMRHEALGALGREGLARLLFS